MAPCFLIKGVELIAFAKYWYIKRYRVLSSQSKWAVDESVKVMFNSKIIIRVVALIHVIASIISCSWGLLHSFSYEKRFTWSTVLYAYVCLHSFTHEKYKWDVIKICKWGYLYIKIHAHKVLWNHIAHVFVRGGVSVGSISNELWFLTRHWLFFFYPCKPQNLNLNLWDCFLTA